MAASVNSYLACKTLPNSSKKLIKNALLSPNNRIGFSSALHIRKTMKTKQNFTVRAAMEGYGGEDDEQPATGVSILEEKLTVIELLKQQLLDSARGQKSTESLTLLNGKWILA